MERCPICNEKLNKAQAVKCLEEHFGGKEPKGEAAREARAAYKKLSKMKGD